MVKYYNTEKFNTKKHVFIKNFSGSYMSFSFSWERQSSFRSSSLMLTSCSKEKLAMAIVLQKEEKKKTVSFDENKNI